MSDATEEAGPELALPKFDKAPVAATLGLISAALSSIGTLWIGFLMLLIVADVVGRNFLDAPITGVAEIAAHSVVAIVFLQLAHAIMQGRLTRADFLLRRIDLASPNAARLLEAVFSLGGAVIFALLVWAAWPKAVASLKTHEFFGVQGVFTIPTFPFRAIIVLGAALATAGALLAAFNSLKLIRKSRR